MGRKIVAPLLFIIIGLTIASLAVFAYGLGLDPSIVWGTRRIVLLIFGVGIVLCTVLYMRYTQATHYKVRQLQTYINNLAIVASVRRNRSLRHLAGLSKKYWFTFPILMLVSLIYIWFISSGTWITWVSPTHYYADLAIGFLKGNLYLPIKVGSNLLKSADPYEPLATGSAQGPVDYSYYHGKYYLYWGPVPALILLLIHPIVSWRLGDLQLVFGFVTGLYILQCLLAVAIWDRFFSDLPKYTLWLSILLAGLASPVTFILNNYKGARIYEAAITGGQFFLVAGFLLIITALVPPVSLWRLTLAGICWALSIGTRLNLALPIGFMVCVTGWRILSANHWSFKKIPELIPLGLPLALGLVGLGWYNWARFGSVTESGLFYQLPGAINLQKHYSELINPIYILQNLYNYFLYPFGVRSQFPYIFAEYGKTKAIFSFYALPALYNAQAITGLVYTVPFVVFALIPAGIFFINLFKRKPVQMSPNDDERRELNWMTLTLSGICLAVFGFLLSFFWTAMRYLEDVMPSLMTLSIIGFWQGYQALSQRLTWKRLYTAFGVILAILSILSSTLLALSINDARFGIIHLLTSSR